MILRRLGNKQMIANEIVKHFPQHSIYIDLFFGAGGIYFNKPKAKYNFLNDLDGDVFNLFNVFKEQKDELLDMIEYMPIHEDLFKHWKQNKETEPLKKAVRFLMLSNFAYLGAEGTMATDIRQSKRTLVENILKMDLGIDVKFMNCDFREVLNKIPYDKDGRDNESKSFIYADPPYLNTSDNYSHSFTETDTTDLFQMLVDSKIKFAISEFDNEFVLSLTEKHKLKLTYIGERRNLKNRRTEILITNYDVPQTSLF